LKAQLPPHISLVDEISNLLSISNDSAYRRIRGEKPMSFEELKVLCSHYKISLDQLLHLETNSILFTGRTADAENFSFELYLESILQNLRLMNSFENREMLYLNKDVPIFHHFNYPELAAFKSFFWMKTILQYPQFSKSQFSINDYIEPVQRTGKKIVEEYLKIPSQEIWNVESINSTIRQIEYYKDTKVFSSKDDVLCIYNALEKTIAHIEKQAEVGYKLGIDDHKVSYKAAYNIYINEFILGDNTILALLNGTKIAFINHSTINYVMTKDGTFCNYIHQHFQNIIRKSSLISTVGEKERSRFFNTIHEKINNRKAALLH
jgi:hypothetical protein